MGIILLLPAAFYLPPVAGMGMLIAIYVGGSCGGAVSAILLRIPGTPLAAATLLDGFPLAKKGRAGDAIGVAISASAIGGVFGGIILIFFAPLLARVAVNFGPPEYFALAITGLMSIAVVSDESTVKGALDRVSRHSDCAGGHRSHVECASLHLRRSQSDGGHTYRCRRCRAVCPLGDRVSDRGGASFRNPERDQRQGVIPFAFPHPQASLESVAVLGHWHVLRCLARSQRHHRLLHGLCHRQGAEHA